ncbi:MAG: DUF1194 domain-containing protein, partial [Hyphomicrobium sp.]
MLPRFLVLLANLILAIPLLLLPGPAKAEQEVDLLLVLAADVSRSVDEQKFKLQRNGYAAALVNPRVLKAIESGPAGRIAICFMEWSGPSAQAVMVEWTIVANAADARRLGEQIRDAPRPFM